MKKIISSLIVLALMVMMLPVHGTEAESFSDYEKEAEVLTSLSILEFDFTDQNYTGLISRAEFVTLTSRFMEENISNYASHKTIYTDVAPDNKYFMDIACAYEHKLTPEGEYFYPDKYISFDEAEKILLTMTGYVDGMSKASDYRKKAMELKIIKGVRTSNSLRKCDAVRMLYNCLNVDYGRNYDFNSNNLTSKKDKKAISVYRGIYRGEGIVSGNYLCSVDGRTYGTAKKESIIINNEEFICNFENTEELLGCNVEYYYQTDLHDNKVIYYAKPYKTDYVTINARDFISFDGKRFYYRNMSKTKYLKISDTVDVIYNWSYCADYTFDDILLTNLSGNDSFIDNDGDGSYDLIIVNEYKDYSVSSIDTQNNKIYTKQADEIIDLSLAENLIIKDKDRGEIDIKRLASDGILTVQIPKRSVKMNYFIYNSSKIVTGSINGWDADEEKLSFSDGNDYYVNSELADTLAHIPFGTKLDIYIDYFGEIGYIDFKSKESEYGYLIKLTKDESEEFCKAKILDSEGNIAIYDLKKKVSIDGVKKDTEEIYKFFIFSNGEDYTKRQLIKFDRSENGEITRIDTKEHGSDEYDKSELKLIQYKDADWFSDENKRTGSINSEYCFTKDSTIFVVPNIPITQAAPNEYFRVTTLKDYYIAKNQKVTMDVIDPDDAGTADFGVYYYTVNDSIKPGGNDEFSSYEHTRSYMVYKVRKALNDDDEVVTVLDYYDRGYIYTAEVIDDNVIKKPEYKKELAEGETDWLKYNPDGSVAYKFLARGDVIQLNKDDTGKITGVYLNHDSERVDNGRFRSKVSYENPDNAWLNGEFGMVYSKAGNGIRVVSKVRSDAQLYNPQEPDKTLEIVERPESNIWKPYDFSNTADLALLKKMTIHSWSYVDMITVYDTEEKKIRVGSYSDIIDYKTSNRNPSLVYIKVYLPAYRQVFLYK